MSNKLLLIILTLTFSLMGCASATKFSGDAKIEGGPAQCESLCEKWNMELVGMVALGEYTNGCICKKKGVHMSMLDAVNPLLTSAIGAGGVIGKIKQDQAQAHDRERGAGQLILEILTLPLR